MNKNEITLFVFDIFREDNKKMGKKIFLNKFSVF